MKLLTKLNEPKYQQNYHICLKYAKNVWNSRYTCRQCVKTKKVWKASKGNGKKTPNHKYNVIQIKIRKERIRKERLWQRENYTERKRENEGGLPQV